MFMAENSLAASVPPKYCPAAETRTGRTRKPTIKTSVTAGSLGPAKDDILVIKCGSAGGWIPF